MSKLTLASCSSTHHKITVGNKLQIQEKVQPGKLVHSNTMTRIPVPEFVVVQRCSHGYVESISVGEDSMCTSSRWEAEDCHCFRSTSSSRRKSDPPTLPFRRSCGYQPQTCPEHSHSPVHSPRNTKVDACPCCPKRMESCRNLQGEECTRARAA